MIEIVCCLDDRFVEFIGVMLDSLFLHNRNEKFRVHVIFSSKVSQKTKDRLSQLGEQSSAEFCFYELNYDLFKAFPTRKTDHISVSAYIRLFMSEVLPNDIEKVLYLDGDILVVNSVRELWDMELGDAMVAAVEERYPFDTESPERLGYPKSYSYFNSGVLLVNLKKWKECNFAQSCLDFIKTHYDRIHLHDQDVLNALLYDKKKFISIRWNLMDFFLYKRPEVQDCRVADWEKALENPAIIHFTGRRKPWVHCCDNPYRDLYIRFAKKRGWKVQGRISASHYFLRKHLYRLIKRKKTISVPTPETEIDKL